MKLNSKLRKMKEKKVNNQKENKDILENEINEEAADLNPEETEQNLKGQKEELSANYDELKDKIEELSGKNEELLAELEKAKNDIDSLRDVLQRRIAEIDNIKRRHRDEMLKIWADAEGGLITELLPVIDNFDRAAEFAPTSEDKGKVIEGFVLIHDSLMKILHEKGLRKIEAKGKPFDYNFHNAVGKFPNTDVEPDTVLEEVKTGYIYKDSIIRHSDVIISEAPDQEDQDDQTNEL
ncbi:MAG: Protein GrpE [Ignavibacteriaceae bacterium]|nr:Protein GrpE [Ignavibacteriaceae bacterium]